MNSYLTFKEIPNEGKKTKKFIVSNKIGEQLGWIYWKGAWRKYIYLTIQAEYDTNCMEEICRFLKQLMAEHKVKQAEV